MASLLSKNSPRRPERSHSGHASRGQRRNLQSAEAFSPELALLVLQLRRGVRSFARPNLVLVFFGHSQSAHRLFAEVELDDNRRFVANYDSIMPGLDTKDLRSAIVLHTAIRKFHVNGSACEEADVRVHAQLGTDLRLHVLGPAEAHGINQS